MRILHVSERYGNDSVGGAQLSVASLARAQAATDENHHVGALFIGSGVGGGRSAGAGTDAGVELIPVGESWSCRQLRKPRSSRLVNAITYLYEGNVRHCAIDVLEAIDRFKPEIINTHIVFGINEDVWRLARRRGIPVIHTIRDYFLLCARSTLFRSDKTCGHPCTECRMITARRRRFVQHLSGVVSISESLLATHLPLINFPCPTRVIGNSISPDSCAPPKASTYRDSSRAFIFGYIGRLVPAKGIEALIEAFKLAAIANSELLIAGDGPPDYVESLRALLPLSGVRLIGRVAARSFYGEIDAAVVPSVWGEPFGRVVAEAILSGVPLICSNRGAFPELLTRYDCGLLVDPKDSRLFAEALTKMRNGYSTYFQQAALAQPKACEDFSESRVADAYLNFYSTTIEGTA